MNVACSQYTDSLLLECDEKLLDVSDLRVVPPSQEVAEKIDVIWRKWKKLDIKWLTSEEVEAAPAKVGRKLVRNSSIAIPRGFEYLRKVPKSADEAMLAYQDHLRALEHPRHPAGEEKMKYLNKLSKLFAKIPRAVELKAKEDNVDLECMRIKRIADVGFTFI